MHQPCHDTACVTLCSHHFQRLEEVETLAPLLAQYFPDVSLAETGLRELMVNAIEHGNLEIGFEQKTALLKAQALHAEIERRLNMPEFKDRMAKVAVSRSAQAVSVEVCDDGAGFCWKLHVDAPLKPSNIPHGRGIAIAQHMCFDSLSYNPAGNVVVASVLL